MSKNKKRTTERGVSRRFTERDIRPHSFHQFPAYSLPRLYGWHMIPKQHIKDTGKIFQYFGSNFWDLLETEKLPIHKGKISLNNPRSAHAIIFVNIGVTTAKLVNKTLGDVYMVYPGKRSTVNNVSERESVFTSDKDNEMFLTKIGNVWIILLRLEEIKRGQSSMYKSPIFTDFLLMCGIPDKDQYLNTMGIESFEYTINDGWRYDGEESDVKSEWIELLLNHWKIVNPRKKGGNTQKTIPKKIHWIWLRRNIDTQEFGALKPLFYKFMDTWVRRNPGFEFNLWTDNPNFQVPSKFSDILRVRGPDEIKELLSKLPNGVRKNIMYLYYNHKNVGARSDTLRQCILYFEGGMYSDVNDGACLAPMGGLFENFDFLIGIEPVMYVNNAIIGSCKKHIIPQAMITWLSKNAQNFVEEWNDDYTQPDVEQDEKDDYIVSTTGPIAMSQVIFGVLKKYKSKLGKSLILPSSWVYPNYWIPNSPAVWLKPMSITAHYDRRDYLK